MPRTPVALFVCIVSIALVGLGCGARLPPQPPALAIALRGQLHVDVQAQVQVQAESHAAVAIEGAAVVEFFGVPLDGATEVVFVLDRSGSMTDPALGQIAVLSAPPSATPTSQPVVPPSPTKLAVAQRELVDALTRLPAGTRTNVIFFSDTLDAVAATPIVLDEATRPGMIDFVETTAADGRTALATALRAAFLMNASRIVLLSDGLGNVGGDAGAILRDAREAMRGGVRIDTIGIGVDQDRPLLDALARESGGIYQAL